MKKLILAALAAMLLALATASAAFADVPPGHQQQGGQKGYEGHPGNQSHDGR